MAAKSRCMIVLRPFRPFVVLQIGVLTLVGLASLLAAVVLGRLVPALALLPITFVGLLCLRRYTLTTIELRDEVAVARRGVWVATSAVFRRRRVDVFISRPPIIGDLWDVGDVTIRSEQSSVTVRGIAGLRCLEQWLRQS